MRLLCALAAVGLAAACLALPAASASVGAVPATGPCTGLVVGGVVTGYCTNDPNCQYYTGVYVAGILVSCLSP